MGAFSLLKSKSSNSAWPSGGRASNTENNPAGASIMVKAPAIDVREFARFILSGVTATIGNMAAVWLARRFLSFEIALLTGIATAITISFALSKFFAFRSRSWNRAVGEAARFLIVYATGCAMYWTVAVFIRMFLSRMAWQSKSQNQGAFWSGRQR
jgi:putative flippase GtrA